MRKKYARAVVAVLCALAISPTLSSAEKGDKRTVTPPEFAAAASSDEGSDYARQVNPAVALASLFPEADQISLAVAIVPDPLVPRYRRLYDLDLVAIELGMLKNGYVLDRFYLPWNKKLQAAEESKRSGSSSEPEERDSEVTQGSGQRQDDNIEGPLHFDRGAYGLLIFRCDTWRHSADNPEPKKSGPEASTSTCGVPRARTRDVNDGLDVAGGSRFRALYIVTDTSTKGVEGRSLRCVMDRISSQLPVAQTGAGDRVRLEQDCWQWKDENPGPTTRSPHVGLMTYPGACRKSLPASTLVILGPSFSGTIDSVGTLSERLRNGPGRVTDICLVSSSATDNTNGLVDRRYARVSYANLALDNGFKILHIMNLVQALTGTTNHGATAATSEEPEDESNRVAILAEASTFGHGVCSDIDVTTNDPAANHAIKRFCNSAIFFYFPANIADIRYGLQEQRNSRRSSSLKLPVTSEHLSLELGAENGSEYPDSSQSGLTSVSAELALEQVLDTLKAVSPPPRIVIVVATDVRDRLFLFDELRERLPRAMLIDLEADNLLGHPDFLHASRGAVAMASTDLNPRADRDWKAYGSGRMQITKSDQEPERSPNRPISAWSSDVQALLARAIGCLADATSDPDASFCGLPSPRSSAGLVLRRQAALQVVTLEGLKRVSKQFVFVQPPAVKPTLTGGLLADWGLNVAEVGAPVICAAAAWLWVFPLVVPSGGLTRRPVRMVNRVSYAVCGLYAILLFAVAIGIRQLDNDNSVLFWILAGLACGVFGLSCCVLILRHASLAAPRVSYWNAFAPALLAVGAALMASTPLWWLRTVKSSFGQTVDLPALVRLGLDPDPGLAFLLLVALATIALLYASVVLATAAGIVNRNSILLRRAQPWSPHSLKRFKAFKINRRGIPHMNPFGLLVSAGVVIAAIVGPDLFLGNVRLTIFGQWASIVALLAITATTCSAALLACSAIGAARRVAAMSEHILIARCASSGGAGLGPWSLDDSSVRVFPATPVIATVADGGSLARELRSTDDLTVWIHLLKGWLYNGLNRSEHRVAVFTLLATEISLYRWSVAGAVMCTLASVGAVYLFPIEADRLLMLNLIILAALGVAAGYVATAFERDELLSNILCNRQPRRRFSAPLFGFIAAPFIVLALAVAITNIPGVVDWGGGLLQLLETLGVHA